MMGDLPAVGLVSGIALAGLWASNFAYDRGVPHYVSRKIGHAAGGLSFLAAFAYLSSVWSMALAAIFGAILYSARLLRPTTFRGVGGTGRNRAAMAEIWFVWVAVPVTLVSWYWLHRPEIAVTSLLFMAWGDGVTGVVRASIYHQPVKGLWGSLAMLCVCLTLALAFIRPFWIGAAASVLAVVAEYLYGENGSFKWADDNLAVPLVAMGIMLLLMLLSGNLRLEAP
jgi:phytol kinase